MAHVGTFFGATLFALVFLWVRKAEGFQDKRGGALLSFSAGVAVAYVFVDIMPHLASKQQALLAASEAGWYGFLEHHTYLVSLIGFLVYLASFIRSETDPAVSGVADSVWSRAYITLGACAYVGLISYMLSEQPAHRREPVALFSVAMAMHIFGVAQFVRWRLGPVYESTHRWIIAAFAYLGWLTGVITSVPDTTYALLFAFLAGGVFGIAVTVEVREVDSFRRFRSFAMGAAVLVLMVLLLEHYSKSQ
jgi:hypothetical protein